MNGQASESGGPLLDSERDGAERVRNVEQIRGLAQADVEESLLTKPISEAPVNPWTTYRQLAVAGSRASLANPAVSELAINVNVSVPASEMQGLAETLRRYYQSEETAQQLDERDRSLQMPPRTVADANPQLNGWMAQVAMSNAKLELNDDTLRKADSGKFDDGGEVEAKKIAAAFISDSAPEAPENNAVHREAPNLSVADAFKLRMATLSAEWIRNDLNLPFLKGALIGFWEDGIVDRWNSLKMTAKSAANLMKSIGMKPIKDLQDAAFYITYAISRGPKGLRDDARNEAQERLDDVQKKIASLEHIKDVGMELFDLSQADWALIFQDRADELDGKLSDDALLLVMGLGQEFSKVIDYLLHDPKLGSDAAEIAGRVAGMILYDAAETYLAARIVQTKAAQLVAVKAQRIIFRLEKIAKGQIDHLPEIKKFISIILRRLDDIAHSHMCFVAGTPVHTLHGLKRIEEVEVGDLVLTRPEDAGGTDVAPTYKPVLHTFVTYPTELLHITVESDSGERETIVGTGPHPFYVERARAFVPASDLQPGDRLSLPEGRSASVLSIRHEHAAAGSTFTTYNFEVANHHTYFVGKAGVWVHNSGATPCQFAEAKYSKVYDKLKGELGEPLAKDKAAEAAFDLLDKFRHHSLKNNGDGFVRTGSKVAQQMGDDRQYVRHLNDMFLQLEKDGVSDVARAKLRLKMDTKALDSVKWGDYLGNQKSGIGGRKGVDARGYTAAQAREEMILNGLNPDADGKGLHAHHVNMKEGGKKAQADVRAAQEMLAEFGIDPIFGLENLVWAPNGRGHSAEYAAAVKDAVKTLFDTGSRDKEKAAEVLRKMSYKWLDGDFMHPKPTKRWKLIPGKTRW